MTNKQKKTPETGPAAGEERFPAQLDSRAYPPLASGRALARLYNDLGQGLYQLGLEARQAGREETAQRNFSKASQAFLDALQEHREAGGAPTETAVLLLYLALSRTAQNRYLDAFRADMDALAAAPELALQIVPHAHRLLTPDMARSLPESDGALREAAALPGLDRATSAMILNLLGRIHLLRGEFGAAQEIYQQALERNPSSVYVLRGLSETFWQTGDHVRAVEIGQQALELARQRDIGWLLEEITLQQAGYMLALERDAEAQSLAEAGLALRGSQQPAFQLILARSALRAGELTQARRLAYEAINRSGSTAEQQLEGGTIIAEVALKRGELSDAAELGKKALMSKPGYLPALLIHSKAVIASNPPSQELIEQAVSQLRFYVERQPADLETLKLLLGAMQQTGAAPAELLAVTQRGLDTLQEPDLSVIRLRHAGLLYELERYQEAYEHLERVRPEAQKPEWWILRARSLWRLNRLEEAHAHFEEALKADPANLEWLKSYATFLVEIGSYEQALDKWEAVLAAAPEDQDAWSDLARLLLRTGELDAALAVSEKLLEADLAADQRTAAIELKGDILAAKGEPAEEIARYYYDQALKYKDENHYLRALPVFAKAAQYSTSLDGLYWQWIESLRMGSYQEQNTERAAAMIRQAMDLWEQARAAGLHPAKNESWAYCTRALLNLKRSDLKPTALAWEAILHLEAAIRLHEPDSYRWVTLAHYYRKLNGQANSLVASARALEIEPDYLWALEERLIVTANTGDFEEAHRLATRYMEQEKGAWIYGVMLFILRHMSITQPERLEEAEPYMGLDDPDPFYREQRAAVYQQRGDEAPAIEEYRRIWESYDPLDEDNLVRYANAAYLLGTLTDEPDLVEQAAFAFKKVIDDPVHHDEVSLSLGLLDIYRAHRESGPTATRLLEQGVEMIQEGIQRSTDARTLEDFLYYDLQPFKQRYNRPPAGMPADTWENMFERLHAALQAHISQLPSLPPPLEELQRLAAELQDSDKISELTRRVGTAAARASQARLLGAEGSWSAAAQIYHQLAQYPDLFPEDERAWEIVLAGLQDTGDQQLQQGAGADARQTYQQALEIIQADAGHLVGQAAGFHSRLALAHLQLGEVGPAHQQFTTALEKFAVPTEVEATFAKISPQLLSGPADYWQLQDALEHCRADIDPHLLPALAAARHGAQAFLNASFQLDESGQERAPLVTPVAIEFEESLIPSGSPLEELFINEYLPQMRTRILSDWGMQIPGMRLRSSAYFPPGGFQVLIDDVPFYYDSLYTDRLLAVSPPPGLVDLGIPESEQIKSEHPLTGQPGSWVPASYRENLDGSQIEVVEPFPYMIYRLEAVLRGHLSAFIGVQETENLIFTWIEETHQVDQDRLFALLPDRHARLQFRCLLRTLVDQLVPLTHPEAILQAVERVGIDDIDRTVLAARQELKALLPGNRPGARLQPVPNWVEAEMLAHLSTAYDRTVLAAPPVDVQNWLLELRQLFEPGHPEQPVLILENPDLHHPLRNLLRMDSPQVQVITRAELLEEGEEDER